MAKPQCENGYTRWANELLEAIILFPFTASERKVVLFIGRKTYGFGKKWDAISLRQFSHGTFMDRSKCHNILKKLIKMSVVCRDNSTPIKYCIQKNYERWAVLSLGTTVVKNIKGVVCRVNKSVVSGDNHKRKKETITKEIRDPLDKIFPIVENPSENNSKKEWLKYLKTTQEDPPKYPEGFLYWLTKTKKIREIDFVSIEYDRRKNIIRQYVEEYL